MVTPYALSQDYNIEEYRLDKVVKNETKAAETEEPTVLVSTLKGL